MARKEDKQPQYLPLIVKAKLHTGGRDYEKIKEELKGQFLYELDNCGKYIPLTVKVPVREFAEELKRRGR